MSARLVVHVVGGALLIASGLAWYQLAVARGFDRARAAARAEEALVERRAGVEHLLRRRDRAAVDLAAAAEERSTIAIHLLPAGALNQRIAELTALAEEEGLRVERIVPGAPSEAALASRVPLRLGARGGSIAGIRFLAALRRVYPDVAVEGFMVVGREGEADAVIDLDCVWYADREGGGGAGESSTP